MTHGVHHEVVPGGITLYGTCPRCGAAIESFLPSEVVKNITAAPASASSEWTVMCTCACDHPGRPEGTDEGCGAYWPLTMDRTSS
ncbi:hypothetical protein AB0D33_23880 [Streptomyces sp. NPDC048404]|uniref:hypothetical protein n=1 Tax=unclassified Streptomyces TaxID=2593676 RepID=UPI003413A2CA